METILAHRERVDGLRSALDELFALHRRLYDLRSDSWREQSGGGLRRAEALLEIRQRIVGAEEEVDALRARLTGSEAPVM